MTTPLPEELDRFRKIVMGEMSIDHMMDEPGFVSDLRMVVEYCDDVSRDNWAKLTNRELVDGYLTPHAGKCDDEGLHVRAIALREAIRRLETL